MTAKPQRRAMTPARKRRIYAAQAERHGEPLNAVTCGNGCGALVPVAGDGVVYEHVVTFHNAPHLDDDGPNVQAWCPACSAAKNARGRDPTTIAKTKRQARKLGVEQPDERPAPKMRSGGKLQNRGFAPGHRPLRSRNTLRRTS
jgi:hypothetical protein